MSDLRTSSGCVRCAKRERAIQIGLQQTQTGLWTLPLPGFGQFFEQRLAAEFRTTLPFPANIIVPTLGRGRAQRCAVT
jgi:hypothetical protein